MSSTYSNPNCTLYVRRMQEKNISPMPIIGLYVALASLICFIAMFFNSHLTFSNSKGILTHSSNFFGLNATWLTILAVATKLTGDLTSPMWTYVDNISKITSTVFLTIAMAQFLTSLGFMNGTNMLANLTALSILVFTVLVDLCIQLETGVLDFSLFPEIIFALVFLFCVFTSIVCTALAIPAIKKRAESKHQMLVKHMEEEAGGHLLRVEELRLSITKYWVMAASEEPPNCWTLPVMTLTSIAAALPNIANEHVDDLVSSVDEGLQYASHIDELDENHVLKCIKNAASVVWVGVKLHKKWLDMDLGNTIREVRSTREVIQGLADEAERIVKEFNSAGSNNLVENPLYWPPNVLAANSMYRIN
nr:uncharacterized protein LOC109189719 [Ipomoea batatas]